jgi:hypothetical protein
MWINLYPVSCKLYDLTCTLFFNHVPGARYAGTYSQTNLRHNLLFNMPNNKFFECWVYTGTFTKCVKYISSPYISPAPLFFWRQFSSKLQNFLKSGSFDPGESCELYNRANLRHTLLLNHAE